VLLHEMMASQCFEWALIIATALLNVSVVIALLRENPSLYKAYIRVLQSQKWYRLCGGAALCFS
jgi:hypothetical protein